MEYGSFRHILEIISPQATGSIGRLLRSAFSCSKRGIIASTLVVKSRWAPCGSELVSLMRPIWYLNMHSSNLTMVRVARGGALRVLSPQVASLFLRCLLMLQVLQLPLLHLDLLLIVVVDAGAQPAATLLDPTAHLGAPSLLLGM
jgi:hypothetical protein